MSDPETNVRSRRRYNEVRRAGGNAAIEELKELTRYGGRPTGARPSADSWGGGAAGPQRSTERHQKYFGPIVVSCEQGEMRQSRDGILIYGDEDVREVPCDDLMFGRQAEVTELYEAVVNGKPMFHDGRWGMATLEVCLGILRSAAERREILMTRQVPTLD